MIFEKNNFSLLLKNMPGAYAHHRIILDNEGDPVDCVFLHVNPTFENMIGLKKEKIIGRKATEIITKLDLYRRGMLKNFGKI
ncbi:MAG: PAS domain S-box protein, partial [Firmicutes bacterium]|nr:PAS domain S-box protein [Bacillota bacterium]